MLDISSTPVHGWQFYLANTGSLERWTGSRTDWGQYVKNEYDEDLKRPAGSRIYQSALDANDKLFSVYDFPSEWEWTKVRAYENVKKAMSPL